MVLLDTNVIIDIWRDDNDENINTLKNEEVCICGVVKSELMHGAVSEKNLEEISSRLSYLDEINIKDSEWDEFGKFLYKLRTNGLTLPYADAMIAFIAIKNNLSVKTKDKHFSLISVIVPELKLYDS